MFKNIVWGAAIALITTTNVQAEVKPVLQLGIDVGGDDIATAYFNSGDNETVTAGGGVYFEGGVDFQIPNTSKSLDTQLLLGYKFDSVYAKNGDIDLSRLYLTAIENYNFGKVSVGAGATYHISPELSSSGAVGGLGAKFDSAIGAVLQAGFNINPQAAIGLRATFIDYESSNSISSVNADSVGIFLSYKFAKGKVKAEK